MNWLDRCIGYISPSWGYKRISWRKAFRGSYDSGNMDRLNSGWTPVNAPAEQTDRMQRDLIRARARDLERNSDVAEAIIGPMERNVVGTGLKMQAKIREPDETDNESLNQQFEDLWADWCRARNCDITGQQSFQEMQGMAIRRLVVDGGLFFIKVYTKGGTVPFALQVREVDELDGSINDWPGLEKNRIIGGIELDQYNRPVAYWFKQYTPDGFWTGKSDRYPAKNVIFLWKKQRPSQIREISPLARTLPRVRDINEFIEAVSVKERILACLSVFITKQTPGGLGRTGTTDKQSGYTQKTLAPGMITELQPGESATAISPSGQSSNAKEFVSTHQRLAGSGQGLSYEAVSRDMSQVNYSSARQGLLEDQRTYLMWQRFLIDHLCQEVYTEFVVSAVLAGKLPIPDFWQNKAKYLKHTWIAPGWSWIDPLKEVTANNKALETGQETLENICAQRGLDWREVLKQRAKEQALAKELGITLGGGDSGNVSKQDPTSG